MNLIKIEETDKDTYLHYEHDGYIFLFSKSLLRLAIVSREKMAVGTYANEKNFVQDVWTGSIYYHVLLTTMLDDVILLHEEDSRCL